MSAASNQVSIVCGACNAVNEPSAKFCSACGQSLTEPCPECSSPVAIDQNFCVSCGFDLKAAREAKRDEISNQISQVESNGEEGKFEFAIRLARQIANNTDFRFSDLAAKAQVLAERYTAESEQWQAKVQQLAATIPGLIEQGDFAKVAASFSVIPEAVLTPELIEAKKKCENQDKALVKAKANAKEAIAARDWGWAAKEVAVVRDLLPDSEKYATLADQILNKILKQAKALQGIGKHNNALELLESVPVAQHSAEVDELKSSLQEVTFIRKIVAASPFTQPLIGESIARLDKLTPDDPVIQKLVTQYEKARRKKPEHPFQMFPRWMKVRSGRFSESIAPSMLPFNLKGSRPDILSKRGAQFMTSYGLALQGMGVGQQTGNFLHKGKSGMLGRLGLKKKAALEACWGIDFGDSSIKALKLVRNAEGELLIDEALMWSLESKSGEGGNKATRLFKVMEKAVSDANFKETPAVCNLPNSDLLARYLDLPTEKESQHDTFVDQEAQANIPINADLLGRSYIKFAKANETAVCQQAMLLALRKQDVDARVSMFKQLGVELVAITPEPVANVNAIQTLKYFELPVEVHGDALLLVDVGYLRTTFQVIGPTGSWYRTIDWGLDSINSHLATTLKITNADADGVRRNVARSKSVSETLGLIKDACMMPQRELERSLRAAEDQLKALNIRSALLIGSGAYQPLLGSILNNESL
ncbi:MAG: pilus assembly protein PilM [Planctomycetota bacterium]